MSYNKDQVSGAWKLISVQSWLCDLVFIIWCNRGDYDIQILMACSKSQTHFEGKKQRMFQKRKIKHILKTKLLLNQWRPWLTDLKNVFMRLPVNITENKLINKHRLHSKFLQIPVKSLQVFQRDVNLNFSAFRDKSTYKITFIWLSLFCIK